MDKIDIEILLEENRILKEKYETLEQKERIIRVINNFATSILEQDTVEDILWAIAKNAIAKLGFVDCVVYLLDEDTNVLHQKAAHGPKNPIAFEIYNEITIPLGMGVVGTVAKTGIPELINDTSKDPRYIIDDALRFSELAVPIIIDNKVIGVIDSEHPDKNFFTSEHLQILNTIALMSSTRILNAFAKEKLREYQTKLEQIVDERTAKLKEVINELKSSNLELEQYAYVASHDLQEPLRTIRSFLQLIQESEKGNISESSKEYIDFAVNGAERMQKLLEGLLEYSRVRSEKKKKKPVNLNSILLMILHNLNYIIEEKKVVINTPKELPSVLGHSTLLHQLFQNLISNSIKFRQKNISPIIDIHFEEKEKFFQFEIKDNGIGLEKDQTERVFELFTRLHAREEYEGSGLGLSLCQRIVKKHGGEISIHSEGLGKGSLIKFTLSKN